MSKTPQKKSKSFGWITGGVVAAVTIIGGALFFNAVQEQAAQKETAVPTLSAGMGKPMIVGDPAAANTLTIWEDYQCPYCKGFEQYNGGAITDAIAAGKIKVEFYMASFLSEGSRIAANGAACAADQGKYEEYHQALFIHQPSEQRGEQFSVDLILKLGKSANMADEKQFEKCVTSGRYLTWVDSIQEAMSEAGIESTPTAFFNGKPIDVEVTERDLAIMFGLIEAPAGTSTKTGPTPAASSDASGS